MTDVITEPIAEGLYLAQANVVDWVTEPASYRELARLLDCDYPRWRNSQSAMFRTKLAATRHFAKSVVAQVAGLDVDDIELRRDQTGRPAFIARGSQRPIPVVDANLSHTRERAVVAVSTRGPVGVDIEASDRRLDRPGFADAICHPDELRHYHRTRAADRHRMLLEVWTWKEATVKAMGTGLATAFPTLRIDPTGSMVAGPSGTRWHVHAQRADGFDVTVASTPTAAGVPCTI